MFLPAKNSSPASDLPPQCSFSENDWRILAGFWHPVALSADLADNPMAVTLLDMPLVLYRTSEGVSASKDYCPHRGAPLSLGFIQDDQIVCKYHGFHFDGKGNCTRIPAIPESSKLAENVKIASFGCTERYGFIWVCLAAVPAAPMPEWPAIETATNTVVVMKSYMIGASAGRRVENFNDVAHLPFTHTGTIGGPPMVFPNYKVRTRNGTLGFELNVVEKVRYAAKDGSATDLRNSFYSYLLTLPFASSVKVTNDQTGDVYWIFDVISPVTASTSRVFQVVADESGKFSQDELRTFTGLINEEDNYVVEHLWPNALPLDPTAEFHIPADRLSMEYRRELAKLGLGAKS